MIRPRLPFGARWRVQDAIRRVLRAGVACSSCRRSLTAMDEFDLVIRGGTLATASDVFAADLGIRDGRITAIADRLPKGRQEIDAASKLVLPGGIDAHCHL